MSEQKGFVQGVVFIILFSALLLAVPVDLQGVGETPEDIIPVDPSLISGFSDSIQYTKADFGGVAGLYYSYDLPSGSRTWEIDYYTSSYYFTLAERLLFFGVWLGGYHSVNFINPDGYSNGYRLSMDEIEADASDGAVRYDMQFVDNGNSAGALVIYWNTTIYSDPASAWTAEELYIVHGIGFDTAAAMNIASLLLSILFLQLPDCPILINLLIATPVWANIIFILWFVIKETLPFV